MNQNKVTWSLSLNLNSNYISVNSKLLILFKTIFFPKRKQPLIQSNILSTVGEGKSILIKNGVFGTIYQG